MHICEGSEIAPSIKTLNNYNRFCEKVMSSLAYGPDLAEESGGWISGKTMMVFQYSFLICKKKRKRHEEITRLRFSDINDKVTYYSKIAITRYYSMVGI